MNFWALLALVGLFGEVLSDAALCPASVKCPTGPSKYVIQLPDPNDCASFCKCLNGKAYLQHCPGNLLYNEKLQVCDYPENVDCSDRLEQDLKVKLVQHGPQCAAAISAQCPNPNTDPPTYLFNPSDCHTFCECDTGVAYLQHCPADLVYDPDKHVCVHPEDYPCKQTMGGIRKSLFLSPPIKCPDSVGAQCPKKTTTDPVFLPFPSDPHCYCVCAPATQLAWKLCCAANMTFDFKDDHCSATARLNLQALGSIPERTCPRHVSAQCPRKDGDIPKYLPYPGDRHRFCQCSGGVAYQQQCPSSLVFDTVKSVCVRPEQPRIRAAPPPVKCPDSVGAKCPKVTTDDPVYFPFPGNSHCYCECAPALKLAWKQCCPANLNFDSTKHVCD